MSKYRASRIKNLLFCRFFRSYSLCVSCNKLDPAGKSRTRITRIKTDYTNVFSFNFKLPCLLFFIRCSACVPPKFPPELRAGVHFFCRHRPNSPWIPGQRAFGPARNDTAPLRAGAPVPARTASERLHACGQDRSPGHQEQNAAHSRPGMTLNLVFFSVYVLLPARARFYPASSELRRRRG